MQTSALVLLLQVTAAHLTDLKPWMNSDDYPIAAVHAGGTAWFDLTLSPEGTPWRCEIVQSSGSPALDQQTCALAAIRLPSHLAPASDADGKPMVSVYRNRVQWRPSSRSPQPYEPAFDAAVTVAHLPAGLSDPVIVTTTIVVAANGTIESCQPESGSPPAFAKVACSQVFGSWQAKAARDPNHIAVSSVQQVRIKFAEPPR